MLTGQRFKALCGLMLLGLSAVATVARAEPYDPLSLQRIRGIEYAERSGVKLLTDVYLPPGKGPFPGVLMVHGGAWAVGSKWHMLFHANQLAQHGYAVVAINYRLAPKHKFPAQLDDCRDALAWMHANAKKYRIDSKRIGAYGYSAGGHLVSLLALTAAQQSDQESSRKINRLQAVVAGGAPCNFDWIDRDSQSLAYFLGGSRAERPAAYRQASPVNFATPNSPPFFFFHGEKDRIVPTSSSNALHQSLIKAGVKSVYYVVPARGHLPSFHDGAARTKAIEFLDRTLKRSPAAKPASKANIKKPSDKPQLAQPASAPEAQPESAPQADPATAPDGPPNSP